MSAQRYLPFLLDAAEAQEFDLIQQTANVLGGTIRLNLSVIEAAKNIAQYDAMAAAFEVACEMLGLSDMGLVTSTAYHTFSTLLAHSEAHVRLHSSPKLSRARLKQATPAVLAGVVIDLLYDREQWPSEAIDTIAISAAPQV
jgi:hypothetical protein